MNIVNETANKVRELEKRLDGFESGGSLGVTEIKKEFDSLVLDSELNVLLCHYKTVINDSAVVFQGQFNFSLKEAGTVCSAKLLLRFDGYIVHSEKIEITDAKTSFQVIHTLPSSVASEKAVELVLVAESGNCYLLDYDCFIWGYGVFVSDSYYSSGSINATTRNNQYAFFLVSDKRGYYYEGALPTSVNFSAADFSYISKALSLAGVYLPVAVETQTEVDGETIVEASEEWKLFCFKVAPSGALTYLSGDNLSQESEVVASGASAVSVVLDNNTNEAVVVYAAGKSIYYFGFDGTNRTENILLYTFDEYVEGVSLVENCSTTSYLVVSLESGKNYLFSSITTVSAAASKEGRIVMKADISFN